MKLYSGPLSLFTAKVRIALAEKSLAYERIEVGWSLADRYLPHHPEVVRLNPKAEVPVLVDDDTAVYDSTIILEYLEERSPTPPLLPKGAAARAEVRRLEAAADEIFFPQVWDLIEESFYPQPPEGRDPGRLDAAKQALRREYDALETRLADRDTLGPDGFGVADIAWIVMVNAARTLGAAPEVGHGCVLRWIETTAARAAVAKELAETREFVAGLFGAPAQMREDGAVGG